MKVIKRLMDIVLSLIALFLLFPFMLMVAVLVYFKLGSPILFTQDRVGKNNKIFKMYKFRTMIDATDKEGKPLQDEERLTEFGKLLRSTSLDELPELVNILKGDMSIVGPRPLLVEYLPLYSERQARRHEVTPGLTGWAQINGRNAIAWSQKFEFDIWYIENWNLVLDIKIILMTVVKVFKRSGISQSGEATMEFFNGNN